MPKLIRNYNLRKRMYDSSGSSIYNAHDDLYAWYKFDQDVSESGDLIDSSGNGRSLSPKTESDRPLSPVANSPGTSPGFPKRSTEFDNDLLINDNDADFVFPGGFTISTWVKFNDLAKGHIIVSQTNDNDTLGEYSMYARWLAGSVNRLYIYVAEGGEGSSAGFMFSYSVENPLTANQWHHLTFTYDGGTSPLGTKIYVDGEDVRNGGNSGNSFSSITAASSSRFTIGNFFTENGTYDFDGSMAELAVWSREFTSDEVANLYTLASQARISKSGYLTNPVRTIIRENDYRTGSYPMNVRTGDRDFSGKSTIGMNFDDTNTIVFVSPFAKAQIEILGNGSILDRHWIGLTSSDGSYTKDFEFNLGTKRNALVDGSIPVYVENEFAGFNNEAVSSWSKPTGIATRLANAINTVGDDLKVVANAVKNVVHLRYLQPAAGTSNTIVTGTNTSNITNVSVKQFTTTTNSKLRYPTGLIPGNQYENQNISSPNVLPDLEAYSDVKKGIGDYGIHFTPGENISPFSDDRITLKNTQFYATGTAPEVLEGFSSPLRSKTQLVFNLKSSNGVGTHLFYATGSGPLGTYHSDIAGKLGSGFSYWNNSLKRWEMVNTVEQNEPRSSSSMTRLTGSVRGFSGPLYFGPGNELGLHRVHTSYDNNTISEILERYNAVAQPVNTSGFPMGTQYNATGSQCLRMSDHISSPFLLEKISVVFKVNLGLDGLETTGVQRLNFRKFFILCQSTNGDSPHTSGETILRAREHENGTDYSIYRSLPTLGRRELVTFGRICLVREDSNFKQGAPGSYQNFVDSFDKVIEFSADDSSNLGLTSSFSMDIEPKLSLNSDITSFWNTAESSGQYKYSSANGNFAIDGNDMGGADLLGNPSGRQVGTSIDTADFANNITGSHILGDYVLKHKSEYSKSSPYLLFPEDNLVFGWENIPEIVSSSSEAYNAERMVDRITEVKITLFGSLVRNDREFIQGTNQPLTSDGVHEAILGEPIVDQWDVEPISNLSGSTRDALFFGDMFSTTNAQRGRRGSIASGDAGNTGSLNRNVHFLDKNVIYSDSRVPTVGSFFEEFAPAATGSDSAEDTEGNSYRTLILSNRVTDSTSRLLRATNILSKTSLVGGLNKRLSPTPFAGRTGNVSTSKKLNLPFLGVETTTPTNTASPVLNMFGGGKTSVLGVNASSNSSPEVAFPATQAPVSVQNLNTVESAVSNVGTDFSRFIQEEKLRAMNTLFFGAPLVSPFLGGIYKFPIIPKVNLFIPELRGFKFGFQNLFPTSPVYHFRRGSYGQMRDLMETPVEGKMNGLVDLADEDNGEFKADQNAETAPVQIVFVSRGGDANISPLDTNTQNLSQFATSSEPYYDGESRERDIVNDPPPDLTDKTTIEEAVEQIIDGDA